MMRKWRKVGRKEPSFQKPGPEYSFIFELTADKAISASSKHPEKGNLMSDPFSKVPEFLAAFEHVRTNGFFENIECTFGGGVMLEGKVSSCHIKARGCVPNHKKYSAEGCGALINPVSIIKACKKLAKRHKVKQIMTKIETSDWVLWDEEGENVLGSKGTCTEMFIYIQFEL